MLFYLFDIQNNRISDYHGEVDGTGPDFHHYEKSFGNEEIYYKTVDGKIAEIICEAFDEKSAKKAVDEFLSSI